MPFPLLRVRAVRACLIIGFCGAAGPLQAQPAGEPSGELSLAQAIHAVQAASPDLRAGEIELRASAGRIVQASLRPNPELSFEAENFAGTGEAAGRDILEATLSLSQVVELGGRRERRRQVASAAHEKRSVERRIAELEILAEATRRYIDVVVAQERLSLGQMTSKLAQEAYEVVARRVKAARTPRAEQGRAASARARSRLSLVRAGRGLETARLRLAAMWGSDAPGFARAVADLWALPEVADFRSLAARLDQAPGLLRYAAERSVHEAELALARARARPGVKLSAGVRRLDESDDVALVAGVSLPLPLFDRRQGERAESRARIEATEARRSAAYSRSRATLFALRAELDLARTEVEILRGEVVVEAERALEQIRSGFERGRFSYLELASAQQDVLDATGSAIDAAADFHRLRGEIERLMGGPVAP